MIGIFWDCDGTIMDTERLYAYAWQSHLKQYGLDISEDEIISYTRTQIAAYKCPKSIEFIKELPRNPSGKILRRELRDPYWEGIDRKVSGN